MPSQVEERRGLLYAFEQLFGVNLKRASYFERSRNVHILLTVLYSLPVLARLNGHVLARNVIDQQLFSLPSFPYSIAQ